MTQDAYDIVTWEAGQIIFERNEPGDVLFYIRAGRVRIELGTPEEPLSLGEIGPGFTFGELALIDHEVRSARARAVEPTEAIRVTSEAYERCLQDRPEVLRGLLRSLTQRLRNCTDLVENACRKTGS
jgi:CRP-like cAMP-binding protein